MKDKLKLLDVVKVTSMLLLFLYFASVLILSYDKELYVISNMMFFLFAGMVIFYRLIKVSAVSTKFYIYIILILSFSIMSYYWAIDKPIVTSTTKTYFNLTLLAIAIINILESERDIKYALKALAISGVAMCIYTIFFYGFDEMLMMMQAGERLGGEINQENMFGMFCTLSFAILISYAVFNKKTIYYVLSAIPFLCSFTSGSKKVLIALVVTFALLVILNTTSKKIISTVILITVAIIVWNFLSQSEYFSNVFERFDSFRNLFEKGNTMSRTDGSSKIRMNMIKFGWELFVKSPIWGYGTYQFNQLHLENYGWYVYSHCFYIQALTSYGLIGLYLFVGMYVDFIKASFKHLKTSTEAKIIFILTVLMMVNGLGAEYSTEKIYFIILGIGFAFVNVYKNKSISEETEKTEDTEEINQSEEEVAE